MTNIIENFHFLIFMCFLINETNVALLLGCFLDLGADSIWLLFFAVIQIFIFIFDLQDLSLRIFLNSFFEFKNFLKLSLRIFLNSIW